MSLLLINLDTTTRRFMLAEFESDIKSGSLYMSNRLTPTDKTIYPILLHEAIEQHDDLWLAAALAPYIADHEMRSGKSIKMSKTAATMLAESEFNRFYMRGVCYRASSEGIQNVVAYRAKEVAKPRAFSQAKRGQRVESEKLLAELRHKIVPTTGIPAGPNSGISVRLP